MIQWRIYDTPFVVPKNITRLDGPNGPAWAIGRTLARVNGCQRWKLRNGPVPNQYEIELMKGSGPGANTVKPIGTIRYEVWDA